jgi:hypothetical protein
MWLNSPNLSVINNISKDSRLINVSFSSNKPNDYVDCGQTSRRSNHPATGDQQFVYNVADSSSYNAGQDGTNVLWNLNRRTKLDGRANIYIAPELASTRFAST